MAPSRGKGKAPVKGAASSTPAARHRATRSRAAKHGVPDVYQTLLDEADQDPSDTLDRPLKRRRVAAFVQTTQDDQHVQSYAPVSNATSATSKVGEPSSGDRPVTSTLQIVEESSEDDASDLEFEDVDIEGTADVGTADAETEPFDGIEDLSISVQAESSTRQTTQPRRKPVTFAEKSQRLIIHKMHVLCLLGHCMYVNGRCNNAVVQKHLRTLLTAKTVSYLNPKSDDTQFQRNRSFMDGLQQAFDSFSAEYRITTGGLTKPQWEVDGESSRKHDFAPPMDRSDFITAARDLEGSQDTGNQLFCAMLRSVGVDARIVCSLQVLPFTSVPKQSTPKKPVKTRVLAIAAETPFSREDGRTDDASVRGSRGIGGVSSVRRRLGQPTFAAKSSQATPPKKKAKPVPKLSSPVFWTEAFNAAQQKWVAVDPVVTRTINKPAQLEPPASYELNQLTYVVAFEDGGTARDVTKRYAKAYNAKTRRHRVEASAEGVKWFRKAMRIFRRRAGLSDRDQVEDAELAQKEAREGMPVNVLDFKDHPYYALERHLKRHEVIHPKREVGKVNAGTAAKPRLERVYRRQDVFVCKSADKWYRLGREIKEGEQPLKHVASRSRRQLSIKDNDRDEPAAMTGLYAPHQTRLYVPPPVQRGHIPRNVYGNLDLYVPSMVPAGGEHVRHELAQKAAKLLRVDYADAVTGFKFQGRHGTAIVEGVVVAQQHGDAVRAIIEGFEYEKLQEESIARSLVALRFWKRFLSGLRIAERVNTYADSSAREMGIEEGIAEAELVPPAGFFRGGADDEPLLTAGQFTMRELTRSSKPAKQRKWHRTDDSEDDYEEPQFDGDGEGDFLADEEMEDADALGRFASENGESGSGFLCGNEGSGGGFIADDDVGEFMPEDGGGFIPEEGGGFVSAEQDEDDLFGEAIGPNNNEGSTDSAAESKEHDAEEQEPTAISTAAGVSHITVNHAETRPTEQESVTNDVMELDAYPAPSTDVEIPSIDERDNDDGSDVTSILSHDPEDDDAEPDWLESD